MTTTAAMLRDWTPDLDHGQLKGTDKSAGSAAARIAARGLVLRGPTETVVAYLGHAICAILVQRGLFPAADFSSIRRWGVALLVPKSAALAAYVDALFAPVPAWLRAGTLRGLALAIADAAGETVELWEFELGEPAPLLPGKAGAAAAAAIQAAEDAAAAMIRAVLRQIAASITYLPLLRGPHTFHFSVCEAAPAAAACPPEWAPAAARAVDGSRVEFGSVTASRHHVDLNVTYAA